MGKRRSMMRKKKYDDRNTIGLWSDVTHDVLLLVMMNLGVVDFLAFSRVCKSWRSLAVSNKNKFIVSKPPMSISISTTCMKKTCYLEDSEGKQLKITLPHFANRKCIGVTCGYFILFHKKPSDFFLVNPITRHQFQTPLIPYNDVYNRINIRAIFVFSPSISEWVLVVFNRGFGHEIWFFVAGKGEWTYVSNPYPVCDLHVFKGNIYTIYSSYLSDEVTLCKMKVYPETESVLFSFPKLDFLTTGLVSCGENIYVIDRASKHSYKIHEIDVDEMKLVSREKTKTRQNHAFFFNKLKYKGIHYSNDRIYVVADKNGKGGLFYARMWYLFDDCLNVHSIHD